MKTLILRTAAALLVSGATATAADLPARLATKAPPIAAQIFSWTGSYAGANVGYGFGNDGNITTTGQAAANVNNVLGGARPGLVRLKSDGVIGGGQIGYNWQFSQSWVAGLEADIAYTDFRDTTRVTTAALVGGAALNNTFSKRLEYLGTVRGRVGYAFDTTLIYATGGLAYGEVRNSVNFFGPAGQLQFTGTDRQTKTGYTVGAGIEHAFTPNWSVKGEYLYYDLGRDTVNVAVIPGSGGGGTGYNSTFRNDGHIVRAGINYRFDGPMWAY
jgi:outer membrane immunogenic protein